MDFEKQQCADGYHHYISALNGAYTRKSPAQQLCMNITFPKIFSIDKNYFKNIYIAKRAFESKTFFAQQEIKTLLTIYSIP
jgi:hypothetical protein